MQNSDRLRDERLRAADPLAPGFGLEPMVPPAEPLGYAEQPKRLDAEDARQGGKGRPVLYVLIAALILGGFYLMGTTFWAANEATPPQGRIASTEQTRVNPVPAPAPTPTPNAEVTPQAAPNGTTAPPAR